MELVNKHRKIIIPLLIIGIIVVFTIIATPRQTQQTPQNLQSNQQTNSQTQPFSLQRQDGNTAVRSVTTPGVEQPSQTVKTYSGITYSIVYPANWTPSHSQNSGIDSVSFTPNSQYLNPVAPTLAILMMSTPFDQEQLVYTEAHYTRSTLIIGRESAIAFTGQKSAPVIDDQ